MLFPPATQTPFPTPDVATVLFAPFNLSVGGGGAYAIVRTLPINVFELVTAVHRIPFCENARRLEVPVSPDAPTIQIRLFGEIAVLVCPCFTQTTVPVVPKISFRPIPCDHVFPSMVYVTGEAVPTPAAPPIPPATAMASCGCC